MIIVPDKSQERLKKRLFINSVTRPKKNNNSIIYSNNYKNIINDEIKENKYNNIKNMNHSFLNLKQMDIKPVDIGQRKPSISLYPFATRLTAEKNDLTYSAVGREIFSGYHPKFRPSKYSSESVSFKSNFVKAYSYNTRDYNEDTKTATKVFLDSRDRNISFYFGAVNDGHGGDGCSLFLKNLHKKEISIKVLKNTIDEVKKDFLKNIPVVNGKLYDLSGS